MERSHFASRFGVNTGSSKIRLNTTLSMERLFHLLHEVIFEKAQSCGRMSHLYEKSSFFFLWASLEQRNRWKTLEDLERCFLRFTDEKKAYSRNILT